MSIQDVIEKTDAELAAQSSKRKEHGKRLQEMQQKQRAEKVSVSVECRDDHAYRLACGKDSDSRDLQKYS